MWNDLLQLGLIGSEENKGLTRTALSESDLEARKWFETKAKEFDIQVRTDQSFNQIAIIPCRKSTSKICAVGSHLDTVPNGGMFDGALGVVAGLECARTILENKIDLSMNFEVINFCDEEAAYNAGTIGSRAMVGLLKAKEIFKKKSQNGISFAEQLKRIGGDPLSVRRAKRNIRKFGYFLELHIEQGKYLENKNINIGVVTAISGIRRILVTVTGNPEHAGTTPMELRNDALVKAAELINVLPKWIIKRNRKMVGTVGRLSISPGAVNVIPGRCEFVVELRSQINDDVEYITWRINEFLKARNGWKAEIVYDKKSQPLSMEVMKEIEKAASDENRSFVRMSSGAGHDAQSFSAKGVPTGMIFIPCKNGISHNYKETIKREDAIAGCQVLMNTILRLSK